MEQEIIEMKNIVKNELTVKHDTIICDPYLGRVSTRQSMVKTYCTCACVNSWHLCLCFYCLSRILACACAIKSKQTATSHLLPLSVTSCCTHRKRERRN